MGIVFTGAYKSFSQAKSHIELICATLSEFSCLIGQWLLP